MQDMDDFIIDQLRESPELIPDLLKSTIQDLTAEEDNFKSVMKTLYYITRAREGGVSESVTSGKAGGLFVNRSKRS